MATSYPTGLDSFDAIGASDEMNDEVGTRTHREMHNDANDAIEAIEAELGTSPSGSYDTVAARLAASDPSALLVKANNLSDLASASTARTNLGLGTMATADASDYLSKAGNLGGIADLAVARTNLGLGTMSTAAASDYLSKAGNLSGIADPAVARTNLGLGSMATASASAYAALAGATFTAATMIDGSANAIQLRVQGHSTQTTDYFRVETSAGTSVGGWDQYGQLTTQYVTNLTSVGPYIRLQSASQIAINSGNAANVPWAVRGMAAQSGDLFQAQNSGGSVLASISAAGLHRWNSAGNEQTTVGAAGGASALPGAPTKYLKVVDSSGATLVIPAYAAA